MVLSHKMLKKGHLCSTCYEKYYIYIYIYDTCVAQDDIVAHSSKLEPHNNTSKFYCISGIKLRFLLHVDATLKDMEFFLYRVLFIAFVQVVPNVLLTCPTWYAYFYSV